MQGNPTLTVIIPCFNHAEDLRRQLTVTCAQERYITELLLVDDGSTDHSLDVMNEFAEIYSFVRIIKNPKNMGAVYSLKYAENEATCDLISYQSADDLVEPDFYKLAVMTLKNNPEAAYVCGDCGRVDKATNVSLIFRPRLSDNITYISPRSYAELIRAGKYRYAYAQTLVFRRGMLKASGGLRYDLGSFVDILPQYLCGFHHGFCYIPKKLSTAFVIPNQLSQRLSKNKAAVIRNTKLMAEVLMSDEHEDIRQLVKRSAILSMHPGLLFFIIRQPSLWSIFSIRDWVRLLAYEMYFYIPECVRVAKRRLLGSSNMEKAETISI